MAGKTRCKQCVNADKKAIEEPCNECAEIRPSIKYKLENNFLDASRNLMREE